MKIINIHEAKTHLSRPLEQAAKGESFIIAKAGKPLVKVVPLDAPGPPPSSAWASCPGRSRCPTISTACHDAEIAHLFGDEAKG